MGGSPPPSETYLLLLEQRICLEFPMFWWSSGDGVAEKRGVCPPLSPHPSLWKIVCLFVRLFALFKFFNVSNAPVWFVLFCFKPSWFPRRNNCVSLKLHRFPLAGIGLNWFHFGFISFWLVSFGSVRVFFVFIGRFTWALLLVPCVLVGFICLFLGVALISQYLIWITCISNKDLIREPEGICSASSKSNFHRPLITIC